MQSKRWCGQNNDSGKLGRWVGYARMYIRLTNLIPELLEMVDNGVIKDKNALQIALKPAVEISYLSEECQRNLYC